MESGGLLSTATSPGHSSEFERKGRALRPQATLDWPASPPGATGKADQIHKDHNHSLH